MNGKIGPTPPVFPLKRRPMPVSKFWNPVILPPRRATRPIYARRNRIKTAICRKPCQGCVEQARQTTFASMPPSLVDNVDNADIKWTRLTNSAYTHNSGSMEKASLAYWQKPKGPSFRILLLETDKQNSTPRGSLLAVMNANREQINQRL
jgi:hypothetical protein